MGSIRLQCTNYLFLPCSDVQSTMHALPAFPSTSINKSSESGVVISVHAQLVHHAGYSETVIKQANNIVRLREQCYLLCVSIQLSLRPGICIFFFWRRSTDSGIVGGDCSGKSHTVALKAQRIEKLKSEHHMAVCQGREYIRKLQLGANRQHQLTTTS